MGTSRSLGPRFTGIEEQRPRNALFLHLFKVARYALLARRPVEPPPVAPRFREIRRTDEIPPELVFAQNGARSKAQYQPHWYKDYTSGHEYVFREKTLAVLIGSILWRSVHRDKMISYLCPESPGTGCPHSLAGRLRVSTYLVLLARPIRPPRNDNFADPPVGDRYVEDQGAEEPLEAPVFRNRTPASRRGGVFCSQPRLGFFRCISSTVNRYIQACPGRRNRQNDYDARPERAPNLTVCHTSITSLAVGEAKLASACSQIFLRVLESCITR
jgi:hypothetical protein